MPDSKYIKTVVGDGSLLAVSLFVDYSANTDISVSRSIGALNCDPMSCLILIHLTVHKRSEKDHCPQYSVVLLF